MKKILSVLVALIVFITSVSQGLFVCAVSPQEKDLREFALQLSDMISEFEEKEESSEIINSEAGSANSSYIDSLDFSTKRLIVKSDRRIDYKGAIDFVTGYKNLYFLQYKTCEDAKKAYDYYSKLEYVDFVEVDVLASVQADDVKDNNYLDNFENEFDDLIGDDDAFHDDPFTWVSEKIGFNELKEKIASKIKDDYIQVAVIDSGVDTDHELLVDRLIENDVNLSTTGEKNSVEDDYGHGTHVAGIIVNHTLSNVHIMPYKILNDEGKCSVSIIAMAIDMAVEDGADIINISISAKTYSQLLETTIDNAVAKDVNVVVAAGNAHADLDVVTYTPACVESAITVSAVDEYDRLSSYSNYDGTIDIAAPGNNVNSSFLNNTYRDMSGTSMSAPLVAAGLALVYSIEPDLKASEAEQTLEDLTIAVDEEEGENHYGAGILYLKYLLSGKPETLAPVFSVDSCTFNNSFDLEITCPEPADIYYIKIDGDSIFDVDMNASKKIDGSIRITSNTVIVAFARARGKKISPYVSASYIRAKESESDLYDINSSGMIIGYYGEEKNLVIPDTIDGILVRGIGKSAFENNSKIKTVFLPDTATTIEEKAFSGCTTLERVTGNNLTVIKASAFTESSVRDVSFDKVTDIGNYAFDGCENLFVEDLNNVREIGYAAFQNTKSLDNVNCESLTKVGFSAFSGSGVNSINLPNLENMGIYVFKDCEQLRYVSIPKMESLPTYTFQNCVLLQDINMPSVTKLDSYSLSNTGYKVFASFKITKIDSYAFANSTSLTHVNIPNATIVGEYAFKNCEALKSVRLDSVTTLNKGVFDNCINMFMAHLPSVVEIKSSALDKASIEYIVLDKAETVKSLPDNGLKGIVVSETLKSVTDIPTNDFFVYGYKNSYAESFASDKGKKFYEVPVFIKIDSIISEQDYLVVYVAGFNCQYQWYENDTVSNTGGTPIPGANSFFYVPETYDTSYYCVVTTDNGTITTTAISNNPEYRQADLIEYNRIIKDAEAIDRTNADTDLLEKLDELLSRDVSNAVYSEQDKVDEIVNSIYGIILKINGDYLLGDINYDGRVSALDVRLVLKCSAGIVSFDVPQFLAADYNDDGEISAIDARLILVKAVEPV